MNEFSVLKINGSGGECRFCGDEAKLIVGSDYDVCEKESCFESALERKHEESIYVRQRIHQIKADERYALNKGK